MIEAGLQTELDHGNLSIKMNWEKYLTKEKATLIKELTE